MIREERRWQENVVSDIFRDSLREPRFCMYRFWDMQISRAVLLLYFLVMASGLMLYTDFHYQAEGAIPSFSCSFVGFSPLWHLLT